MAKAYEEYTKGYLPETLDKRDRRMASGKLVNALTIRWMNNELSYAEYRQALEDIEADYGIRWS